MKRLLLSAFAIAALSSAPALAQSSDHHNPRDKTTHTQGQGPDHSGSHGDHGGMPGGPPGGSSDHTTTTSGHRDHGGMPGGPPGGGSSDHTTTTSGHQDRGGSPGTRPGIIQSITGRFMSGDQGGSHQMPHGTTPRTHRPSNWNQRPHQFDTHTYQRNRDATRRFHWHSYQRPHGWYDHRWVYGEIMPSFFWAQNYWITDWWMFDLMPPPYGYEWVRYGDDALLVNTDTGEVLQVEYNLFD